MSTLSAQEKKNAQTLIIPDVHGSLDTLKSILLETGFIDASGKWIGGTRNIYFMGDLIHRNGHSVEVVDLLFNRGGLIDQAEAAGGKIVVLLGNHELSTIGGPQALSGNNPSVWAKDAEVDRIVKDRLIDAVRKGRIALPVKFRDKLLVHGGVFPQFSQGRVLIN